MLGLLLAFAGVALLSAGGSPAELAMPVADCAGRRAMAVTWRQRTTRALLRLPRRRRRARHRSTCGRCCLCLCSRPSSGLGVIGRVSRLLHTPLMSLTNAISAIAIVGSIMVTGSNYPEPIRILGAIALFASMTNIVSGFLITDRMLKMFRQTRPSAPAAA